MAEGGDVLYVLGAGVCEAVVGAGYRIGRGSHHGAGRRGADGTVGCDVLDVMVVCSVSDACDMDGAGGISAIAGQG